MTAQDNNDVHLVVGYGTFITRGVWETKDKPRICEVKGFRRVYDPRMASFPFAVEDDSSFLAICFEADSDELAYLDRYEGVDAGLYEREVTKVKMKTVSGNWEDRKAWIYIPTDETRNHELFPWDDYADRWLREVITKHNRLRKEFPEFFEKGA